MLRQELSDLTKRFEVTLSGTTDWWSCQLLDYRDLSRFSGSGESPEDAVAEALAAAGYRTEVKEIAEAEGR